MLCGGVGNLKPSNAETQALVDKHKSDIETKLDTKFESFKLVGYSTQVVAGTNYWMKIHTGGENHVHAKIYKGLPHTGGETSVSEAINGKTANCPFV